MGIGDAVVAFFRDKSRLTTGQEKNIRVEIRIIEQLRTACFAGI
jgi:hypothetical protein